MMNISPTSLPHFHVLTSKDPDSFMLEFVVFSRTYDCVIVDQMLKLFPSTIKDACLHYFMGLPRDNITNWAQMQQAFNKKYKNYCRSK